MIVLESVHITFNSGLPTEKRALQGVSLTIPQGEFITVIGSNGAGKSTLLNAVSGNVPITQGALFLDETNISAWPQHKRAVHVARVFQDPLSGTCGALTVEENLALAWGRGKKRGLARAVSESNRILFREKLAHLDLGLENRLSAPMESLSGGQRQSISLLMAALQPSRILLLDEHTAALDPKTAAMVLDLTDRIVGENRLTTLMVTHSMKQALAHGTRTVMLHKGKVVLDVAGEERKNMTVQTLLTLFAGVRREEIDDDKMLLD